MQGYPICMCWPYIQGGDSVSEWQPTVHIFPPHLHLDCDTVFPGWNRGGPNTMQINIFGHRMAFEIQLLFDLAEPIGIDQF